MQTTPASIWLAIVVCVALAVLCVALGVALKARMQALREARDQLDTAQSRQQQALLEEERLRAQQTAQAAQVDDWRQRLDAAEALVATQRERLGALEQQHAQLQARLDEREQSHAREVAAFERQKASLSEQFKVLSNEILEAKTKALQESSHQSLGAVMAPFQQSMNQFREEVQRIHHREALQQGELRQELQHLMDLNQKITAEAHALSTALRGQKKLQGNWGELILDNLLERSGLQPGKDYRREVSFNTDDGRKRPDAIVYLPQGKHLVIDAKVSLNAYTRYVNAEDDATRALALKEHVKAIGERIDELARRDYDQLPGLNSPAMVFMFVPIESAFVEALKADETLFQQALEKKVLVATPTTLLTSLNIVRQLWRYEDQNKYTVELAHKAESVFKKLNTFLRSFEQLKRGLDTATEAYRKAEGQLVSGRGNLVKQVGDFKNLAPAIRAELPSYFTEKAELEMDLSPAEDAPSDATATSSEPRDAGHSAPDDGATNDETANEAPPPGAPDAAR